ncbi:MAG: TetR/AcrR family transcriptional regulator [Candidatus Thorarchaeota archaeon]
MASLDNKLSRLERKRRNQKFMIVEAARKLFEARSYDDVSMEELADAAAVSKQTLYNYFSSKDSIYFGIGIENFREAINRTNEMSRPSLSGRELVLKLTEIFFNTAIEFPLGVEIARRFSIVNSELGSIAEKTLQKRKEKEGMRVKKKSIEEDLADYLDVALKYEKYWKSAIETGKKDGTITSSLTENQLMYYTFILINGVANQMQLKRKPIMIALKDGNLDSEKIKDITLSIMKNILENKL